LRTFQSTGFLKDKGIALSSKVIYGPKGLQFIQFLLFFRYFLRLLFSQTPFKAPPLFAPVCCPFPAVLILGSARGWNGIGKLDAVCCELDSGAGAKLPPEFPAFWGLLRARQKCEFASLVYFSAFRQFSFICCWFWGMGEVGWLRKSNT